MAADVQLSDDEAEDLIGVAERCCEEGRLDPADYPSELLAKAGATILRALRRQARELERERGRSYRDEAPRVQGAQLVEGHDGGGRRHYLRGEPVHCGRSLYLLTFNGWMAGRYERSGNRATFWFSVPGVVDESVIPINADMRFAWPREVKPGHRSEQLIGPRIAGL